jgi:hypothetical protein
MRTTLCLVLAGFLAITFARTGVSMIDYYHNDYYGALELDPSAPQADVRKAYRRLSLLLWVLLLKFTFFFSKEFQRNLA